jgi:hypothetical protein
VENVSQRWSLAASVLINLVFWGVFFSYAYDWPAMRAASAVLGLAGVVCHAVQVWTIARYTDTSALLESGFFANIRTYILPFPPMSQTAGGGARRPSSLPYSQASCLFAVVVTLLAIWLTTGVSGDNFTVEYAYSYAAGAGWFGLYVTGQTIWLLPLLHDHAYEHAPEPAWRHLEFPGQVAGTLLVTVGLLVGMTLIVALGAAINVAAAVLVTARSLRLCWAQPALAEKS